MVASCSLSDSEKVAELEQTIRDLRNTISTLEAENRQLEQDYQALLTETGESEEEPTQTTTVTTLDIGYPHAENWDADAEKDGLIIEMKPLDKDEKLVKAAGTVSAKLWEKDYWAEDEKGDLLQEWKTIQIKTSDYKKLYEWSDEHWSGAELRLAFETDITEDSGILEITFTTGGSSFVARDDLIYLN